VSYQRIRSTFTIEELKLLLIPDKHYQDNPKDDLVLSYHLNNLQTCCLRLLLIDERVASDINFCDRKTAKLPFGTGCTQLLAETIIYLLIP